MANPSQNNIFLTCPRAKTILLLETLAILLIFELALKWIGRMVPPTHFKAANNLALEDLTFAIISNV